jgi:hypothetical protein
MADSFLGARNCRVRIEAKPCRSRRRGRAVILPIGGAALPAGHFAVPAACNRDLRIKIESCREGIELTSPGIAWEASSSTLEVEWLLGSSVKGQEEEFVLRIRAE